MKWGAPMKIGKKFLYYLIVLALVILMYAGAHYFLLQQFENVGNKIQIDINEEIRPSTDFVDLMTNFGDQYFENGTYQNTSKYYSMLTYDEKKNQFSMDEYGHDSKHSGVGNLTGVGVVPLAGIKREEMELALSYNAFFEEIYHRLKQSERIYYISESDFVITYPWVSSDEFSYSEAMKNEAYYLAVKPENNPFRRPVWTPVYYSENSGQLMVSVSGPVYNRQQFMGAVCIDLTTNRLAELLESDYSAYLVDVRQNIVATNKKMDTEGTLVQLEKVVKDPKKDMPKIEHLEVGKVVCVGQDYVYKYKFEDAPWVMYMVTPKSAVFVMSFVSTLPILVLGLLFLLTFSESEHRKKAEEKIREIAITDELTGLNNRYFLESLVDLEIERSERYQTDLSMIMLDLDHFKLVNDTWGHPVGDLILKEAAKIAKDALRKSDYIVRMGGEEFLILLPQTEISGASTTAEKIRKALNDKMFDTVGKVTASFGVAQKMEGESYLSLYKRVDEALYHAKQVGRNRVVCHSKNLEIPIPSIRLEWNDKWNSGEKEIDRQHKELIALSNQLLSRVIMGESREEMKNQIELLFVSLKLHFDYEEIILERIHYPERLEHAVIHNKLLEHASRLKLNYYEDELKASLFFTFLLNEVISAHVLKEDFKFFAYL